MNNKVKIQKETLYASMTEQSDPLYSAQMRSYMKHHFEFLGLRSPARKLIQKPVLHQIRQWDIGEVCDLAGQLWEQNERECQYAAVDFLVARKKHLSELHLPFVERLIVTKSWWDSVDPLASHLVGEILRKSKDCVPEVVDKWSGSENIWLIRTAIIHQLKYGADMDLDLLFTLVLDHSSNDDFFIRKASGWGLRQASKFHPAAVSAFVDAYGGQLSHLTYKEATKYL